MHVEMHFLGCEEGKGQGRNGSLHSFEVENCKPIGPRKVFLGEQHPGQFVNQPPFWPGSLETGTFLLKRVNHTDPREGIWENYSFSGRKTSWPKVSKGKPNGLWSQKNRPTEKQVGE